MTIVLKPTLPKKLLAFIVVIALITEHSNGVETHTLMTWAVGSSVWATIAKILLAGVAFHLACVSVRRE